jgi:hypothetical protein
MCQSHLTFLLANVYSIFFVRRSHLEGVGSALEQRTTRNTRHQATAGVCRSNIGMYITTLNGLLAVSRKMTVWSSVQEDSS